MSLINMIDYYPIDCKIVCSRRESNVVIRCEEERIVRIDGSFSRVAWRKKKKNESYGFLTNDLGNTRELIADDQMILYW